MQSPSSATIRIDSYHGVREALFNQDLSRTLDRRRFHEGNIRFGVVSTLHGEVHRLRRRLENKVFRIEALRADEAELFPRILADMLDPLIRQGDVDLFRVAELLGVVLASKRVGVDVDWRDPARVRLLDSYVDGLVQMSGIADSTDPERTREVARTSLAAWEKDFVRPSWDRRLRLIELHGPGSDKLPNDLLTALLVNRGDPALQLVDDATIVRELATYAVAKNTDAITLVNAVDLVLPYAEVDSTVLTRIVQDRPFAQRCVHETLRLRPTTPEAKRWAEADTQVGERSIPRDSIVVLDIAKANRDELVFGSTASDFDPSRRIPGGVAQWGLSFGAGPHQCPGRTVSGGFPVPPDNVVEDGHLFGLVALMLQQIVARGVDRDRDREPKRDTRTARYTRWASYPVVFQSHLTS